MLLVSLVPALLSACSAPDAISSMVQVERAGTNQYLVSVQIDRGEERVCAPRVLCEAGEQATVELVDAHGSIRIDIEPPAAEDDDAAAVRIAMTSGTQPTTIQRILVPVGSSGTITTLVD